MHEPNENFDLWFMPEGPMNEAPLLKNTEDGITWTVSSFSSNWDEDFVFYFSFDDGLQKVYRDPMTAVKVRIAELSTKFVSRHKK